MTAKDDPFRRPNIRDEWSARGAALRPLGAIVCRHRESNTEAFRLRAYRWINELVAREFGTDQIVEPIPRNVVHGLLAVLVGEPDYPPTSADADNIIAAKRWVLRCAARMRREREGRQ